MRIIIVTGAIVAALAAAGAAGAGSSDGAAVVRDAGCAPAPFGELCWEIETTTNTVVTASGNINYVTNGTASYHRTILGCTYDRTEEIHEKALLKDGEFATALSGSEFVASFSCYGGSFAQTCVTSLVSHYAGGQMQYARPSFECETTLP